LGRSEEIRKMVSNNVPASRHHRAPKHGDALLAGCVQGIIVCGQVKTGCPRCASIRNDLQ